jgi:hypothetical protein
LSCGAGLNLSLMIHLHPTQRVTSDDVPDPQGCATFFLEGRTSLFFWPFLGVSGTDLGDHTARACLTE